MSQSTSKTALDPGAGTSSRQISRTHPGLTYLDLVSGIQDYAIFMLDAQGHIESWNLGAEKLKGYAPHEILGKHFSIFYPPEAVARGWPDHELREAAAKGRFEDEGWRVRKDGTLFWANVVITALRDPNGDLIGFAKVTRDLTELRRQSEALRQSEELFRLLVENVKDYAIFMLDCDGRVISWNAGATQIKGYRREEILGQHFSVFYAPDDIAAGKPARGLQLARREGRVEDEGWRVRKDGSMFWANVVITAVYDDAGKLRGYAKVTRDMSERKRFEELEQSSRRMTQFLATLAHELRNPLAPVRNSIGILAREPDPSANLKRCCEMLDRQVTHLTRLVDDLLDIGRISSGKLELRLAVIDLREVIARAVESSQPFTDARQQAIEVALPEEPVFVNGDMTRLVQVVQNLLHNAGKYSPPGASIRVDVVRQGRTVALEVRDHGTGIAADALDSIFQLFVQVASEAKSSDSGLGIGLTLCRWLVELHHGSIGAASDGIGSGSVFSVRLPVHECTDAVPAVEPEAPAVERQALRVLVVDDNRDSAESFATLLSLLGHDVRAAHNGAEAIAIAGTFAAQIAFIDLSMPGMDGFSVLRALRALPGHEHLRCIAMTGFGQAEDMHSTREAGFEGHLVKPVDLRNMEAMLDLVASASGPTPST